MKYKNLLVESNFKAVKRRLQVTLDNIKYQKGKAFIDDVIMIEHSILALENMCIKLNKIESNFDKYNETNKLIISNLKKL